MIQRISTLHRYLFRSLLFSLSGLILFISALGLWWVFFSPTMGRVPELPLFTLLVGLYGGVVAFLATLNVAGRANRAESAPMLVRLPSRIEYLASILTSALSFTLLLQTFLTLIVLLQPGSPDFNPAKLIEIPPLWIAINIFAIVLAFHATDFVMSGWSRVTIFALVTLLLFSQSLDDRGIGWVAVRFYGFSNSAAERGWDSIATNLNNFSGWLLENGYTFLQDTIGFALWPFRAIAQAVRDGIFDNAQALAPAIILLYATILFMLAANVFGTKDLHLLDS